MGKKTISSNNELNVDIAVFGAGPAGIMASISAARLGASVVLVEKQGFSGGIATAGLVTHIGGFHAHNSNQDIIGGIPREFVDRLVAMGGAVLPEPAEKYDPWQGYIHFDSECYKLLADRMLAEARVRVFYHATACDIEKEGDLISKVYFHSKAGTYSINARTFVDTTGDGDLLNLSDLPVDNSIVQGASTIIRIGGIDVEQAKAAIGTEPTEEFRNAAKEIHDEWSIRLPWRAGISRSVHKGDYYLNLTRMLNVNARDNVSLTQAEIEGREQARAIIEALVDYHPAFASAYLVQTSTSIGIRCSSRLIGEYQLTEEDVLSCRSFKDTIAKGSWPVDVHNPLGEGTLLKFLPEGGAFNIPVRCLYNKDVANLITAGRSLSASVEAHGAARIQATAMATGQAAGVLGTLLQRKDSAACDIDPGEIRDILLKWGAVV